jgi:hypothetical protein
LVIVEVMTMVTIVSVVAVTVMVTVTMTPPRLEYEETGGPEKQLVSLVDYVTLYNGCT